MKRTLTLLTALLLTPLAPLHAVGAPDAALVLTPDAGLAGNARPFLTHSRLDLGGPVTAILRVRAADAGQGRASITCRTKEENFEPHQSAAFDWPGKADSQEVRVQLAEKSRIIHLRIHTPRGPVRRVAVLQIEPRPFRLAQHGYAGRNGLPANGL